MEQAITDYVKFLADARDAVYRLNNDQATAKQLKEQGERQEKELAAAKKAVTDSVNQTIKKRRSEIDTSYDKEIAKGQERLKKARTQREKAKNKGMKERIAEETSELREHNRDLQIQMKTMFQKDKVPVFCRTTFYYSLYYARGLKERLIGFITFLICFLALPCGVYFLLPDRKIWYLVLVYFADIIIFGGLYVTIGNRSRSRYHDALKQGREIRNLLSSNEKKIKVIVHSIEKDGNEDIYDLEKYDDEIACAQQELSDIAAKKKDAISSFENVTRNIIADEIEGNHRAEIEEKEQKLQEVNDSLAQLESSIRQQNIHITDTFGPYLGKEYLNTDKLAGFVIILTAYRDKEIADQAVNTDVMGYIVKPVDEDTLIPAVKIAIHNYKQREAMAKEFHKTQEALDDRKYLDRAKGLVMERKNMSEKEAFTYIRSLSMDKGISMTELSKMLLKAYEG